MAATIPRTLLDWACPVERTRRGPGQFAAGCCRPNLLVGFGQPFPGCGRGFYQQTINCYQFDRYTMTPFDRALGVVLGHEGGDSDHAADPG